MSFKKCQVVMLPTNQRSNFPFFLDKSETRNGGLLSLNEGINKDKWNWDVIEQKHLYIVSNDEIKEGDWFISQNNGIQYVDQCKSRTSTYIMGTKDWTEPEHNCKKIIATTDTSLTWTDDNDIKVIDYHFGKLPQPSQSFIEKYVEESNKGNKITEVMVEYNPTEWLNTSEYKGWRPYPDSKTSIKRNTLKINPKDNTITIKKVKDSWNRDEVKYLMELSYNEGYSTEGEIIDIDKWIEENL